MIVVTRFLVDTVSPISETPALSPDDQSVVTWMRVKRFGIASILVVCAAFVSKIVHGAGRSDEVDRMVSSIQWIYADSMGGLLEDPINKRVFALVGFVVLPYILESSSGAESVDAVTVWKQSLGMTWINSVIGLVVPDTVSTSNAGSEIVAILAMTCCLQAVGNGFSGGMFPIQLYHEPVSCPLVSK